MFRCCLNLLVSFSLFVVRLLFGRGSGFYCVCSISRIGYMVFVVIAVVSSAVCFCCTVVICRLVCALSWYFHCCCFCLAWLCVMLILCGGLFVLVIWVWFSFVWFEFGFVLGFLFTLLFVATWSI